MITLLLSIIGYYNGILADIDEDSIHTGGQCEEGIKLILAIGDVPINPDPVTTATDSEVPGTGSE
jgi:hypothetical protein